MAGNPPYYQNVRWGGPKGGRIPQELFPATFLVSQDGTGNSNAPIPLQALTGATDAVLFPNAINVVVFTSTGPDAATLAVPAAADAGKILILVNTNTSQTTVTTTANKILNGTATAGDTLTAPAHAGAVQILVASSGFWNMVVGGTGAWVLSEV